MRGSVWLLLLTGGLLVSTTAASGMASHSSPAIPRMTLRGTTQVAIVTRDVMLTLAVPRKRYPRDALVRVRASLKDVSKHVLWVEQPGGPVAEDVAVAPRVEVVGSHAAILYPPPPLPLLLEASGPGLIPGRFTLGPGQIRETEPYVILRGSHLRATVVLLPNARDYTPRTLVATPTLALRLSPRMPPTVSLHVRASSVEADVRPGRHVRGPLLYVYTAKCAATDGSPYRFMAVFTPTGRHLISQCSAEGLDTLEWHVVAAWPKQPVVVVDYKE